MASSRTSHDGRFELAQTITFGDGKVTRRIWHMTRTTTHNYTSSLSDASGPVRIDVRGNVMHLRYLLRRPNIVMEQWLYLQRDGRTVLNEGTVTMLGLPLARLSEQIVKKP